MKLGIISDLHSDLVSLDAALARIRAMGCDLVVCAGDLVDGDVFPDEAIARLAAERTLCIRGNHDRWALERVPGGLVCNSGALWSGGSEYGARGSLVVPVGPSYGSFGVLDLPSMRFRVYRAVDGELVLEDGPGVTAKKGSRRADR